MRDAVEAELSSLATEVTPDEAERAELWEAVDRLTDRAHAAIDELGIEAEVLHVGSTARDTWLSGERDIDLFVRFPGTIEREELTEQGLNVGRALLEDGRANYAEHPYIAGSFDGFDVDVVPCVAVSEASGARTAVDRTPFHNAYVKEHLDESLATDVRLAKHLLSGIDVYGSNLKTRGFGGYLLELLILEHGGISDWFEAVADWTPQIVVDLEDHAETTFDHPLVVIDPTDPNRNVAAVTSPTKLARLQHYVRRFIEDPTEETFTREPTEALPSAGLVNELEDRGTSAVALTFDRPDLLDDQLFPQLRKTHQGIRAELDRLGFDVLRSDILTTENHLAILLECSVGRLPVIERHEGPPVHMREHADRFADSYQSGEVYGPFIEGDRYVIERRREIRTPRGFLESDRLFDVKIGDQLQEILEADADVLVDEELTKLLPTFEAELAEYFQPIP